MTNFYPKKVGKYVLCRRPNAFDKVWHTDLFLIIQDYSNSRKITNLLQDLYMLDFGNMQLIIMFLTGAEKYCTADRKVDID